MRISTMVALFSLLIVIIGGGIYLVSQKSTPSNNVVNNESVTPTTTDQTTSRYSEYSKAIYDTASDKRRVLFFYASWCPTCRPADADFRENMNKIPNDVVLLRVNYNDPETDQEEKDLATKYQVTYQHTYVQVDAQDNEVAKWNGGQTEELLKNLK